MHGAATQRPGMVWSSQMSRLLRRRVINLGFSGNGKMQNGSRGVVVPGAQAIEEGWFGPVVRDPVRWRIGDLLALSRDSGVLRSEVEPGESSLLGHHGSLTADEQYVPLLLAGG